MIRYMEKCTEKQLYEFFDEFGATEESVKNDVEYIKEWLKQQPHLPNVDDDETLTNTLLSCKNSVEKVKCVLENYYTVRAQLPEIFEDRDVNSKEFEESALHGPVIPLRKLTPEGYLVIVFRRLESSGDFIPNGHTFLKSTQIANVIKLAHYPNRGVIVIADFRTMNARYVAMILSVLNKLLLLTFISIWSEEDTDLVKVISKETLPAIYGGNEKSLEELKKLYLESMKSYHGWLKSEEKNKADLSKKSSNIPFSDLSLFGVDGSFRKMAID